MENVRMRHLSSGDALSLYREVHQDWTHAEVEDGRFRVPIPREKVLGITDEYVRVLFPLYEDRPIPRDECPHCGCPLDDEGNFLDSREPEYETVYLGDEDRRYPRTSTKFSRMIEATKTEVWRVFNENGVVKGELVPNESS